MENIKEYTKSLIIAYVIALVLLCLTAVIFAYTNINDSLLNTFVFVIVVITNLLGGIFVSMKTKRKGLLRGLIFGIIYFIVIYLISVILYSGFFINKAVGIYLLLSIASGIIGGIVGVNLGR